MKLEIKFGIISVLIGIVLALLFFGLEIIGLTGSLPRWIDQGDLVALFFPVIFGVLLGLGMRPDPASLSEIILGVSFGIVISIVMYFFIGVIIALIYQAIRDRLSKKIAVTSIIIIILLIPTLLVYSQYAEYREFYHIGKTPEDCAKLEESRQGWCYRTLYREYSIPQVCKTLRHGESEECSRRYGVKSGNVGACSAFIEIERINDCKWGVAFINKDLTLCEELPNNDATEWNPSTQESCKDSITKYWNNLIDFYDN